MFKSWYKQLTMWTRAFQHVQKPVCHHSIIVCIFSHRIFSSASDTWYWYGSVLFYSAVPYFQCCYASLATRNAAHHYLKCYINVVTWTCMLGVLLIYVSTLSLGHCAPSELCIYIMQTSHCHVITYILMYTIPGIIHIGKVRQFCNCVACIFYYFHT